jgi:HD-GYP domain-containing protein (c-di-GMP phosphodiesterase class II)
VLDDAAAAGSAVRLVLATSQGDLVDMSAGRCRSGAWRAHALTVLECGESVSLPGLAASPVESVLCTRGAFVLMYDHGYVASQHEYVALARGYAAHVRALLLASAGRLDAMQQAAEAMLQMLEIHEPATARHSCTVRRLVVSLGMAMDLSPCELLALELAAMLHDIGKVGIARQLLRKPTGLSDREWSEIRTHPAAGEQMVRRVQCLAHLAPSIRHHHERWNGTGYPDRLSGDAIPLHAQLIGLADAYEAIRSGRPYRAPRDPDEATGELASGIGCQFSPSLAFLLSRFRDLEVGK